jgi:hypothetical protein
MTCGNIMLLVALIAAQDLASCNEGELSAAKSHMVSNQRLALLAQQAGLHQYVRLLGYSQQTCTPAGMAGRHVHMVGALPQPHMQPVVWP